MANSSSKEIFCYFHFGGKIVKDLNGSMQYEGGRKNGSLIKEGMSLDELKNVISSCLNCDVNGVELKYTLKFDGTTFLDLIDNGGVEKLVKFNDNFAHLYINGIGHQSIDTIESSQSMGLVDKDSHLSCPSNLEIEPLPCVISGVPSQFAEVNASKWENLFVGTGQIISSAEAFRDALYKFSIAQKFDYEYVRNSRDKMIVKCIVEGCNWKLTAYAFEEYTPFLRVTAFHNEHIHSAQDNLELAHKARSKLIASIISEGVRTTVDKDPNEIRRDLFRDYGLKLTYSQAWRAKESALQIIHGTPEQSYQLIPWLCNRLMETDPDTVAKWIAFDNKFEKLFIAYGCCIKGFLLGARKLLYVDGCHLSGPYQGTLLAASAYDADNNMFPFAIAIVGKETYEGWTWFLQNIKEITASVEITIISDRHHAIISAVRAIFGGDRHAFCYRHVKENFTTQFTKVGSRMKRKSKEAALNLLDAVAYTRIKTDFDIAIGNLRTFCPQLARWVEDEGDVDRWALSQFPHRRWDNITTNLAESFNSWLLDERSHNVFLLINEHREKLSQKFFATKEGMSKWKNGVGPNVEAKLKENVLRAEFMLALQYDAHLISIRTGSIDVIVDLASRECTCQAWQMSGVPCPHACAAIKKVHGNVCNFVEDCYLLSSQQKIYSGTMYPIETHDMPNLNSLKMSDYLNNTFLHPPTTSRPAGRPRRARVESQFQQKKTYHCSCCKEAGHTRKKCKNPNPS